MKIPPVKGTRDFYPPEMAVRNWIVDGWKRASIRNGFEEYDGPIFELLKMYQIKSGDEIVEQLFSLQDRGGRDLAIRPEITPTLARMVNQKINALARPIKWFSVPRLCRAERPQKGRLREFFQWNVDIIGADDEMADAEVIFTTIDYLREIGLTSGDVKARISSRRLLAAVLEQLGIAEQQLDPLYALLDKKSKLPPEAFDELLAGQIGDAATADRIKAFMELDDVAGISEIVGEDEQVRRAEDELAAVMRHLDTMGVTDYCVFDPGIVRGLAYYTGVVFEIHDAVGRLRAICGGGRYDNLLKDFGGQRISATGMGMGDCVLEILLREKGLLEDAGLGKSLDYFVIALTDKTFADGRTAKDVMLSLTAKLRERNVTAEFGYKTSGLKKQLKDAANRNAAKCVIIADEFADNKLIVKDMASGEQDLVDCAEFVKNLNV